MFTKPCSENCSKICFLMSNKGLMTTDGPLRQPPLNPPRGGAWDAGRPLRLSNFAKVGEFLIAILRSKSGFRRATGPPRGCNEHAVMLQRGRRCNAIAAPLQPHGALTGGPHPALPKGRETCGTVSGCVIATCKNSGFLTEKTARFWPSRDLKIWERGGIFFKRGPEKRP